MSYQPPTRFNPADAVPLGRVPPDLEIRPGTGAASAPGYADVPDQGVGVRDFLAVLRRHWLLVLAVALAAVGGTAWMLYRAPPQYRAVSVLRLVDQRRALTGGMEDAALEKMTGAGQDPVLSQVQVLRSRGILGEVVDRVGMRLTSPDHISVRGFLEGIHVGSAARDGDTIRLEFGQAGVRVDGRGAPQQVPYGMPVHVDGVQLTVASRPTGPTAASMVVTPREDMVDRVQNKLRVRVRDRTDVLDVEYVSPDPLMSQRIVNAAAEVFREANVRTAQQKSRRRREFVEQQLARTDSVLSVAQGNLSAFQARERVFSSSERFSAEQQGLLELEVRREEMDADRRAMESLLGALQRGGNTGSSEALRALVSSPGLSANPVITGLYTQLSHYENARDSLMAGSWGSVETNPDVERYNSLIASTRGSLASAVRSHLDQLTARIVSLDQLRARNSAKLRTLPAAQAEEARLVQHVETMRGVSEQLRQEYQRARIAEAVEAGQVEIVDLAGVPRTPVSTGRGTKLLLTLVLGLMLGGGAAFLVEQLNTSIRRREELESVLNTSSLAVIPRIIHHDTHRARRLLPFFAGASGNGNGNAPHTGRNGAGAEIPPELVAMTDMQSSGAEAYRTLRTNLIFSQSLGTLRTLVVTSAAPGDGKTTTAANLAAAFAQHGLRVVLVDCDLRRPRIAGVFGIPKEPGLTQLVLGHETLAAVAHETVVERLSVIPSGTQPPNPSELLGGERMRSTLAALGEAFDLVLLDTPPLLAAADAAILGSYADGVVLVVRAGKTERAAAQQARRQLATVGARLLGAVLNDPDAKIPSYSGYYAYSGYYGTDTGKKKA
jgi:succinoglycan biosynthesis transport protein ExoP